MSDVEELRVELMRIRAAVRQLVSLMQQGRQFSKGDVETVIKLLDGAAVWPSDLAPQEMAPRRDGKPRPFVRRKDGPTGEDALSRQRSQIGRIGANARWAKEVDRSAATQAARDGLQRRFEDQVDPDRSLPAEERAKRAYSARRAHFQRLALKSAQARRAKKGGKS